MAVLKTLIILALCFLALASFAEAGRQDSGSESGSASGSEEGPAPSNGGSHSSHSSKGGAAGLMVSTPLFAAASLMAAALALPLARLTSQ